MTNDQILFFNDVEHSLIMFEKGWLCLKKLTEKLIDNWNMIIVKIIGKCNTTEK